ncbi:MAG: LacI family DNA-binding transcriptional regulator [Kosmotogaceae bacterium]
MGRVTLKDVAEKAGTSMMTVSRAINGKPGVGKETQEKIMKIIDELGYRPHADARALRSGKTGRIGVVVSDIRNPFYAELVGDLEDLAEVKGYSIIVTDTGRKLEQEKKAVADLTESGVDSIIIAPEGYSVEHLVDTNESGTTVVIFGVHCKNPSLSEVWIDEIEGSKQAGAYFKNKGIKNVVLVMGNPRKFTTRGRVKGFKKGFGNSVNKEDIFYHPVDWKTAYNTTKKLKKLPEAFFCYNDLMAMGVIKALNERGVITGKDVLVIGYDDVFFAELAGLTTLRIPREKMVNKAFEMTLNGEQKKERYVPKLIMRNSA